MIKADDRAWVWDGKRWRRGEVYAWDGSKWAKADSVYVWTKAGWATLWLDK